MVQGQVLMLGGLTVFDYLEVHKTGPQFEWLELICEDNQNEGSDVIRTIVGEAPETVATFVRRYQTKRENQFEVPAAQLRVLEEFFEEVHMAKVMAEKGTVSPDLVDLLPTTVIHFKYPEKTSFRKSRAARVKMFLDEAFGLLQRKSFQACLHRLDWVHQLDPANDLAFELKVVCLRSWKKMAECIQVFEKWIQTHPDQLEPKIGISEMWLYLDQNARAKEGFEEILEQNPRHIMALVGLAQAKIKLGEDPLNDLRKAWIQNTEYVTEMVEQHMDFRSAHPDDLRPRTLEDISKSFQIPLARLISRAQNGVLPMHPPKDNGLFRFSEKDLNGYYRILKTLGLEISAAQPQKEGDRSPVASQPSLFEDPSRDLDV